MRKLTCMQLLVIVLAALAGSCRSLDKSSSVKVIAGQPVDKPYLFFVNPAPMPNGKIFCGAARIGRKTVLTAAHCLGENSRRIGVVIAKTNVRDANSSTKIPVERVIIHPDYNTSTVENDIAILVLDEHPLLDASSNYITLPKSDANVGDMLKVIGFGKQSTHDSTKGAARDTLQELSLPVIDNQECHELYSKKTGGIFGINNTQICAGYPQTGIYDACTGDSGGPLFRERQGTGSNTYELIGIVSKGFPARCGAKNTAGIYTRVSSFTSWIQTELAKIAANKMELHQDIVSSCYQLSSITKFVNNYSSSAYFSYRGGKEEVITKPDFERLQEQTASDQCELKRNDTETVWVKLFRNQRTLQIPYVIININNRRYLKYTYSIEKWIEESEEQVSKLDFDLKVRSLLIKYQGNYYEGELLPSERTYSKNLIKSFQQPDLFLTSNIYKLSTDSLLATLEEAGKVTASYSLNLVPVDFDQGQILAEYDASTKVLTVHNNTTDTLVTWQIQCPFTFEVSKPNGESISSEPYEGEYHDSYNLVTFKYPEEEIGLIKPGNKLEVILISEGKSKDEFQECNLSSDSPFVVK